MIADRDQSSAPAFSLSSVLSFVMAAPRHVNIPSPICSPRNTLTTVQQGNVDAVLKDLKACTRRLQAALASFQIELQILEKLYYKGNNQHRTALFWRRVADVRRFGRRLETLKIQESLDTIRLSFWGQPSERRSVVQLPTVRR